MTGPPSRDSDPLRKLLRREANMWRTYAVPDARVMFVQVNKNACTSVKWMVAEIAGEDTKSFVPTLKPSTGVFDDIHDRTQWKKSPRLDRIDPEIRAQIHPSNGWFVFAVTRDPRARLFSAWQSKLLLENPGYTQYRSEPWYPRRPLTTKSVIEDFAKFVELLEREPDHRIRRDAHFADQVRLLHEKFVTYTEIYDVSELGRLQSDLRTHLDGVGWTGQLRLPRMNDTPLRPNGQPFGHGIRERVEKLYVADFDRFGDRWDFATLEKLPPWTDAALADAEVRAGFGERMGHLRDEAIRYRAEAEQQRELAVAEKARADELERRLRELESSRRIPRLPPKVRHLAARLDRRIRRT
jgi:sulfotransferase famil protein